MNLCFPYCSLRIAEADYCQAQDCSKPESLKFCPEKCAKYIAFKNEPDWCTFEDCSKPETLSRCPIACFKHNSEPEWCRFADCKHPSVSQKCEKSCRKKGKTLINHARIW